MKKIIYLVLIAFAVALVSSEDIRKKTLRSVTVVINGLDRLIFRGNHVETRIVDEDSYDDVVQEPGRLVVAYFVKDLTSVGKSQSVGLDQKLSELPAKVLLAKVQGNENRALLDRLKIRNLPAIRIYREGQLTRSFDAPIVDEQVIEAIEFMLRNWRSSTLSRPQPMNGLPEGIHVEK
ncbi:thioredoxin family protein [Verrucomicrobiaceae bacterium R5-34]|uniref:Thioredoxin family protein n=1 Tax=Oceaniferula flava TaxID=2800421 RepID=A0AAE2VD89_9BACT|nr:thioredoxin family protein [Oceaniferula flavus]MBK1832186.1 thioredoxin family protein [Verrucomicrobiaceae bacterium R5-34]MBK1855836.1 thioredoxin family protein [Oceaniferula flavus]MBM1137143.1 thioredoxin family protein [Oceaniferula flavus]